MKKKPENQHCKSAKSCFFSKTFVSRLSENLFGCSPLATLRLSASQKGFTLLEVLIALTILSVGLLGLASITASVIRTNSFSDDFTTTTALAQDKLEELVNTTFGGLTNGNDTVDADGNVGSKYSRSWTITTAGTRADIAVTVTWTDDLGNAKSVSISTVKANF
tara:strand:+ start:2363 stop:2854 length:492 start_codon:yes stop_codon:yes gene_type:complete